MQCAVKVQVCTLNVSNLNDQYIFGVPPRRELCLSTLPFHNKSRENAAPASRPAASYNRIGQLYIEDLFVYRKLGGVYACSGYRCMAKRTGGDPDGDCISDTMF